MFFTFFCDYRKNVSNATGHSSKESIRSSTQTIRTTFCNVLETFVQLAFVEASEMTIDLLLQKSDVKNFFTDSAKYVLNATVQSRNAIKPFFYSNNDVVFF